MMEILTERKENFDGMSMTAFDDTVQNLEQNLVLLSSQQRAIREQLSLSPSQPEATLLALQVQAKAMVKDIM